MYADNGLDTSDVDTLRKIGDLEPLEEATLLPEEVPVVVPQSQLQSDVEEQPSALGMHKMIYIL